MGVRTTAFLSACILALKGSLCQSTATSISTATSTASASASPTAINVPAIIKPVVQTYDTSSAYGLTAPSVPNYSPYYPPAPLPPIIIDSGSGGGGNSLLNLIFLMFILNRNKGGGNNGNRGGNCGYGCSYSGEYVPYSREYVPYSGGSGVYDTSPVYFPDAGYDASYANAEASSGSYNGGSYANSAANAGSYSYVPSNTAEISVSEGYFVEEVPIQSNPYPYQTIQPYPGREPNEICLIVRTDYPSNYC